MVVGSMKKPSRHSPSFDGWRLTEEDVEFGRACERRMRELRQKNLDQRQILEVAKSLGYIRIAPPDSEKICQAHG